jgi:hypothetical protein
MKNGEIGKKLTDYEEKSQNPKEKCEEQLLFPKKEWDSLIRWSPVSNIPVEKIYENLPKVKDWHDSYVKVWLKEKSR